MQRTLPNGLFIYLTDGEKVEINPYGYIPNGIFNRMKQHDYDKIMQMRSDAKKRNISKVNNSGSENPPVPSRISTGSDNNSIQVIEMSQNRTIMGGRNEQASIRSRDSSSRR